MNDQPPDSFVRRWLKACGAVLVTLAVFVLIGRLAGIKWLVTVVPGGAPMAFPTIVAFLLAGVAFIAHSGNRPALGRAVATILLLYGVGTLGFYALTGPLPIQDAAYNPVQSDTARGVGFKGRMSTNSATAFVLLALGLLLLGARHLRSRLAASCITVLLAISLIAIVSYVTGLRFSVAWWRYTAMAVHTAAAFLVAATGLLVWLMRRMAVAENAVTRTVPFFVMASAAILVLGAVVFVSNEQRVEATRWMNHTLEVDASIDRFIASVARLESATRAFALTGDDRYVERIQVHRDSISAAADALVRLTTDNPPQHARAIALRPLIEQKFLVNDAQVRARRERGVAAAAEVLRAEPPELMAGLRAATDGMQEEEQRVLARRRAETALNEARLRWLMWVGGLVTASLVGAAFWLVHRAQRDLARANDQLEERVRLRTTELEDSTAQLRKSERRLRFLADTMPQLVWTARPDGTIESLNQGWLDFLGAANEAGAIPMLPGIVHPEDVANMPAEWKQMQRETVPAGGELRLRRTDGSYHWHLWRAHPEHDASGHVLRWVGTCTDIHDQKVAEEQLERRVMERTAELRASEERFRQAFDFAGIGMAIVGLDGRWIRVNKSICDTVGYSEPELLQKTFQDVTHPADLAADLAFVGELIDGVRRSYQLEKRYFHRDGHIVWVRLTVSLIRDANERPVHFVSQIEDITAHKALKDNLANARDQALEASRLKSEFLATMSHEIRTPMNAVIGMTALLHDTPLTKTQADYVHTIESSGESLLTIINDILDYSKIEAGRIELEVTAFDLRQCVEEAVDLFAGRAFEKKIDLAYLMSADVPANVRGDATRLRQVLVNLLGNALKFTERGEVVVTVDVDRTEQPQTLHFAVKDTGIGIAPDGMDRLFKSFSQVDASTTRRFGGTGLGLAISKRLVEVMGGTMWVESEPGKGSTFHFTVLVEAQQRVVDTPPVKPLEFNERRMLIVDDHTTSRRLVSGLATSWGMVVREASTAQGAMDLLKADPRCDVGVIDLQMVDMSGEELARALHALPGCASIPLVLLTSLGWRVRGVEFAQLLAKPIKAEALRAVIRASLRRQHATGKSRVPFTPPTHDTTLGRRCPLHLLIAEDNPVNQRVATLLLERLGYRATVVANGLEAFAAAGAADYDAILMDIEMPELDGCEATRRIRSVRRSSTRPWIIALTAGATQSERDRAFGAGMNDFLTKPVRTEALAAALERAHSGLNGA